MKLHEQDDFLQDLLESEGTEALRQESLQQGLAALRHKRRRQMMTRSAILVSVPMLLCVLLLTNAFLSRNPAKPQGTAFEISSKPATDQPVKVINDQELFALFPNRPMALVGKPGHQRLLFLDQVQN